MGYDEINELHKEWRAIVLDKLTSLEVGQKELKSDIIDIKTTFVKQQALESLREANRVEIELIKDKVEKLDYFKAKVVGIVIGVQTLLVVVYHFFIGVK